MRKLIFILILLLSVVLVPQGARASSSDNVSGYAWSENIGWFSFNCYNDYNNDGTPESHCTDAGYASDYGVNIDASGIFSGYAWSENIGWVSFADFDGDGDIDASDKNIASSPCAPNCEASVNLGNGEVSGWARALSFGGGWDGWIKLRGIAGGATPYGVSINTSTGDFSGWAWSDMVVGWISFNNITGGGPTPYKVQVSTSIFPPKVSDLTESWSYCDDSLHPILDWGYIDGNPDGYQIQIFEGSDLIYEYFITGVFGTSHTIWQPGVCNIGSNGFQNNPTCNFEYNKTYSWHVKAKKAGVDVWSEWSSFDGLTTPAHAYPMVNFSYPQKISVNEIVSFTDQSESFGGATIANRSWVFQDGDPTTSGEQNPTVKFSSPGEKSVTLTITDSDNFTCENSKVISVQRPLPNWKEIPPFKSSFFPLKDLFASIFSAFSWFKNPF